MHATPPTDDRPAASIGARLAAVVEDNEGLDGLVAALDGPTSRLTSGPRRRRLLLGHDLGHALHPLLTDLPIGCWTSAFLLDLLPFHGSRRAAQRLVGAGVAAAAPTVVTGWAEWSRTSSADIRRAGVVHAAANGFATATYAASWLARRSGHHRTGVALSLLGASAATVGGFLGAHLAVGRKVGTTVVDSD
ncbi:MAG TPA: DUF2231 domain-containing protein [Actinomycetaceae bacterium]|nr:DUF2231 domain-containing protein [Actinomycetaceae bacterium]